MKSQEWNKAASLFSEEAVKLLNDLPVDFYGRVVLVFAASKIQHLEIQRILHLRKDSKEKT